MEEVIIETPTTEMILFDRDTAASEHSAELPEAKDSTLPTSFEPEMFKTEKETEPMQVEVGEREDIKIRDIKELDAESGESSQHKKHGHHSKVHNWQ